MTLHPLENIVKKHFGVTDQLEETGYVLSDGTFVDLSGRNQHPGYERRGDRFVPKKRRPDSLFGTRNLDHRQLPSELFDAVGTGEGSVAMFAFLRETGALRLMPGAGFLVARMPTVESVARVVREWHHAFGNEPLYVDVVSPGSPPFRASRVINPNDVRESQEFERPTVEAVMEFLESKFGGASMSGRKHRRQKLSPPGPVPAAVWEMIDFAEERGLDMSVKLARVAPTAIQVDEDVDPQHVKEIVEAIREAGGDWPYELPYPVVTNGDMPGLLDGSHRTAAAIYEQLPKIPVLMVDAETLYEIQGEFDVSRFEYVHEILPHIDARAAENNRKDVGADRERSRSVSAYEIKPGSLGVSGRMLSALTQFGGASLGAAHGKAEGIWTTLNEDDRLEILGLAKDMGLYGFYGECGEVAIAINEALFGGTASLVAAVNVPILKKTGRLVGHVGVRPPGFRDDIRIWDADGVFEGEDGYDEFMAFGMLDPKDPDYEFDDEEEAYNAEIIEVSKEDLRRLLPWCGPYNPHDVLARAVRQWQDSKLKGGKEG